MYSMLAKHDHENKPRDAVPETEAMLESSPEKKVQQAHRGEAWSSLNFMSGFGNFSIKHILTNHVNFQIR